jgi:hypothetical protein
MCRIHLLGLLCLVACADGPTWRGFSPQSTTRFSVDFISPSDGQREVPVTARVVVRAQGSAAAFDVRIVSPEGVFVETTRQVNGDSVSLTPKSPWAPATAYQVEIVAGDVLQRTTFSTERAPESTPGPAALEALFPLDTGAGHVWPFSTFHLVFSEPLSPSLAAAVSVSLVRVATGRPVSGATVIQGHRLAFDPDEDLAEGEAYRLELGSSLTDLDGESVAPTSRVFTLSRVALKSAVSLQITSGGDGSVLSPLDGRLENTLGFRSTWVGEPALRLDGVLRAELPDLGAVEGGSVPMVVRRGQRLRLFPAGQDTLPILLGGRVATGLSTRMLELIVVTDSIGLISANPASSVNSRAPARVNLTLDAAIVAEDATVHALLHQNLVRVEMNGVLQVEGEALRVDLVADARLSLLGTEHAPAAVTLTARSVPATVAPFMRELGVVGSSPSALETDVSADSVLRVVFDAPVEPRDVEAHVWLERSPGDGVRATADDVAARLGVSGSAVTLQPQNPLLPGGAYVLRVQEGLLSLEGGTLRSAYEGHFVTRPEISAVTRAPWVTAQRPGVPCAQEAVDGGFACVAHGALLPVASLPAHHALELCFGAPVDPSTGRLGASLHVETMDGGVVEGRLEMTPYRARFTPRKPWAVGQSYRFKVGDAAPDGCGVRQICDAQSRPLNTDILRDALEEAGGAAIDVTFEVTPDDVSVPVALRLSPVSDTNGNGALDVDAGELVQPENSVTLRGTDGGVVDTMFLSGTLLSTVVPYDVAEDAVPVRVGAGSWLSGTSANIYGITTDRFLMQPARDVQGRLSAASPGDADTRPVLTVPMAAYVHSVNDTVQQSLQREPLVLELTGRVDFLPDGSLNVTLSNVNAAELSMLQGNLRMFLNPGDVRVRARSGPLRP